MVKADVQAEALEAVDKRSVMHTYARQPLQIVRGSGCHVFDELGRAYLDFTSGIAVNALGHCHPALVEAVTDQAQTLWHMSNLYLTGPQAQLAGRLTEACGLDRAFFCNSCAIASAPTSRAASTISLVMSGRDSAADNG